MEHRAVLRPYLHEVLDEWLVHTVPPYLKGRWFAVRFADDFLIGFERRDDAQRMLAVLPKRFEKYELNLHPEKTRLIDFGRPRSGTLRSPESFNFLGFTHYWGRSRKGRWVIKRKTAKDRLNRAIKRVHEWCKRHRHRPIREQHARLWRMARGHDAYYGITGNTRSLRCYRVAMARRWWQWLNTRDRRRRITWARFSGLLRDVLPLPPTRIVHSIYAAKL